MLKLWSKYFWTSWKWQHSMYCRFINQRKCFLYSVLLISESKNIWWTKIFQTLRPPRTAWSRSMTSAVSTPWSTPRERRCYDASWPPSTGWSSCTAGRRGSITMSRYVQTLKYFCPLLQNIFHQARVSQDTEHFLLNPFGMLYNEVTASSLIKVNMQVR